MRIIAGKYRSRQLKSLKGLALRPTSDRLRETLFNVLSPSIENARFLDIFAGTGAIGIEALSRGAAEVVFLENHPPAVRLIRHNLDSLEIRTGFQVMSGDAARNLEKLAEHAKSGAQAFDIVFLDPPYAAAAEYERVLMYLGASPLLKKSAIVVAEHSRKLDLPQCIGLLRRYRVLRQGDAALTFFGMKEESPGRRDS
jgi:16S rRNA (guanine966-N2)-methyltransferase